MIEQAFSAVLDFVTIAARNGRPSAVSIFVFIVITDFAISYF